MRHRHALMRSQASQGTDRKILTADMLYASGQGGRIVAFYCVLVFHEAQGFFLGVVLGRWVGLTLKSAPAISLAGFDSRTETHNCGYALH